MRRKNKGSAVVELALMFPLLATLLIGIVDFSQFLFLDQAVMERARFAARWGAVTDPTNAGAIVNMVLYSQPSEPGPGTPSSFGLTREMVQASTVDTGTDNYRLIVTVSGYSFPLLSPLIAGHYAGRPVQVSVPLGPYY